MTDRTGPERSLSFLLARVAFDSARRLERRLAPAEVTPRQFAILNEVWLGEGRSQQAVADALAISKGRMVALVDDLERRRLLERRPLDRRTYALHLTGDGRLLLRRMQREALRHDAEMAEPLTASERKEFLRVLTKLAAAAGKGRS